MNDSRLPRVACVLGTRPEAVKMAPVVHALRATGRATPLIVNSGQHRELLAETMSLFDLRSDVALDLMRPAQRLAGFFGRCVESLDLALHEMQPKAVVAQGDTSTVLAAALVAFYQHLPFFHVEAGLRTHNMRLPFPEEMNRALASRVTTVHFAPTQSSADNLRREGVPEEAIEVTGNTVIDALLSVRDMRIAHGVARTPGKRLIVVTAHRRENFGERFRDLLRALKEVARTHPVEGSIPLAHFLASRSSPRLHHLKLVGRTIVAGILALAVGWAQAKETPEAKAVLDRAVAAMGGEKAVYGVKTLVVKGESTRITASGKTTSPATAYFLFPMSVRQEVVIEGKTIAMASTPDGAFLDSEAGAQELPESARHTLEASAMRNPVALLKGRRGRMFEATLSGRERIGDADVDLIEIKIGPNTTMLAVDEKGRMVEQRYDLLTESGRKGRMVVRFDDFRRDGGFFYPHKVRAELDGNFVYENTIAEVKRDQQLDPRLFAAGFGPAYAGRPGPPMK